MYDSSLVNIYFIKSARTITYTRSFNKIDDYLSYIGGIIGTIFIIFFIVQKYAEVAYTIEFSSQIIKED